MSIYETSITNPKKQLEFYRDLFEQLEKENQELKSQLEERTKMYQNAYDYSQKMEGKTIILETQQKEFIKYLEDKIYSIEPKGTGINYNCEYDSEEDYVMATQEQSRLNTLKEILQKYKSIIGVSDEKKQI